jgi:hypothetical protein
MSFRVATCQVLTIGEGITLVWRIAGGRQCVMFQAAARKKMRSTGSVVVFSEVSS